MSFDHGILNVHLRKRGGNIDAQIDAYKRAENARCRAAIKAAKAAFVATRAEAIGLVEMVSDARMAELGKPHGLTARACRKMWLSMASRAPTSVVAAMRKEVSL